VSRMPPKPGERIDRSTSVEFSFDGKKITAHEGDTVGSALYAAGQRTFSRSFKYHRRRGLMCCAGQCPNCLVAVDGAPGIRACTRTLDEFSFPSGHTLHSVAFSLILTVYYPMFALFVWPFTILIAVSRIVLGLHYPSDVIVGALIGAITAAVSFNLL